MLSLGGKCGSNSTGKGTSDLKVTLKQLLKLHQRICLQAVAEDSEGFLGAVYAEGTSSWMTCILLNEVETVFKLDTGAEVTTILNLVYERLRGV